MKDQGVSVKSKRFLYLTFLHVQIGQVSKHISLAMPVSSLTVDDQSVLV
jgi:hypothetical protein